MMQCGRMRKGVLNTSKNTTEKKATKKNGLMVGLIACMGVIIVLLGTIVVLLLGRGDGVIGTQEEEKRNVVVNKDNVDEFLEEMEEVKHVRPGSYEAKMNSTWHFPDGSSPSTDAYVENVVSNTNDVYFDVMLADTGEVILESPIIPLGSYIKDITLDKDLDAGTYDCILIYHLVDKDQNTLSTLRMTLTIVIEE